MAERRPRAERRLLGLIFGLSMAALLLNPVGPRLLLYPLDALFNQKTSMIGIEEWLPPSLSDQRAVGLLVICAFVFGMTLIRRSELRLQELALLALGAGFAVRHTRMLFIFGILAAPVVCRLCADLWERYDPRRDNRVANAIMMLACITVLVLTFPSPKELEQQVVDHNPVGAVHFIRSHNLSGNMLNDYRFGGYLIWALPEQKVFVDSRGDVFDWTGVLAEYARWATLEEDPRILLDKYKINLCLLPTGSPLTNVLPYLPGWQKVYADRVSAVFVGPGQRAYADTLGGVLSGSTSQTLLSLK